MCRNGRAHERESTGPHGRQGCPAALPRWMQAPPHVALDGPGRGAVSGPCCGGRWPWGEEALGRIDGRDLPRADRREELRTRARQRGRGDLIFQHQTCLADLMVTRKRSGKGVG